MRTHIVRAHPLNVAEHLAQAFLLSEQQARIQAAARERGKWGVSRRCGRYVGVASVEQAAEARAA